MFYYFIPYTLKRNDYYLKIYEIYKEECIMRVNITLACTETGDRNYTTTKNKRTNPERIEFRKYCPRLRKVTLHRETK